MSKTRTIPTVVIKRHVCMYIITPIPENENESIKYNSILMNLFIKEVYYLSFCYSYLLTFLNKIFQCYGSNLSFNQNTEKRRLSYLKIKPKKPCDNEQNFCGPLIQNTAWLLD